MRKRITQIFPFLTPIRVWQRNFCWNLKMILDSNHYSTYKGDLLLYEICNTKTKMVNENSGHDIIYQKNKIDNLKITSQTMQQIWIRPNEIFSFCYLAKHSHKYGKLKEGLIFVNDKVIAQKGGGICHLSNMLYYLFLMSPLTIIERHGHKEKSFPNPDKDSLDGVDATISSGWLDLKVKNETPYTYQILISFDEEYMYGKILSDHELDVNFEIINDDERYYQKNGKIMESIAVIRVSKEKTTNKVVKQEKLYDEVVEIGYPLSDDIKVEEMNV